jgi:hypothetical protein
MVFAGDRVEPLAELAGGTAVDFRREPTVRAEVRREDPPWQVFPLERAMRERPFAIAAGSLRCPPLALP